MGKGKTSIPSQEKTMRVTEKEDESFVLSLASRESGYGRLAFPASGKLPAASLGIVIELE